MKSVTITLHNSPQEMYRHPIGFKLIDPDGIVFYYPSGLYTMPLIEADFTVEVE